MALHSQRKDQAELVSPNPKHKQHHKRHPAKFPALLPENDEEDVRRSKPIPTFVSPGHFVKARRQYECDERKSDTRRNHNPYLIEHREACWKRRTEQRVYEAKNRLNPGCRLMSRRPSLNDAFTSPNVAARTPKRIGCATVNSPCRACITITPH